MTTTTQERMTRRQIFGRMSKNFERILAVGVGVAWLDARRTSVLQREAYERAIVNYLDIKALHRSRQEADDRYATLRRESDKLYRKIDEAQNEAQKIASKALQMEKDHLARKEPVLSPATDIKITAEALSPIFALSILFAKEWLELRAEKMKSDKHT